MKINDFIFRFEYDLGISKGGICRVRTFINSNCDVYVVLTELECNPSISVTNAIEDIYQQLILSNKIPRTAIIIEHYPPSGFLAEEFAMVTFDSGMIPAWCALSHTKVVEWLECEEDEFGHNQMSQFLKREIDNALNGVPPLAEFQYSEDPKITERRVQIKANQSKIADLQILLASNPSERELSKFIKKDLSILAECYANPKDEYICFSEFPIGDGFADFAIFTGRSAMSVYLIEIKGANHSLRRQDHYGEFKKAVQDGRGQLENRATWIAAHYEEFRKFVYAVLGEVKANRRLYQAFCGPIYDLEVDSNKDIIMHYVVIAGRTSNDLEDSRKRHAADRVSSINIQTESWDSWIKKHPRKD